MQRQLAELSQTEFDLLVIGAGAHGLFAALDASGRGLRVALIDRGDLGAATSANSLRTLHGGVRYLQYLQFERTWESLREQAHWRNMAPELTEELPFVMPCSGWGMRGPAVMLAGLTLHQGLRWLATRRLGNTPLQGSRVIGRSRYDALSPGVVNADFTGAALWSEVQLLDSGALLLAAAQAANDAGAVAANYVSAEQLYLDRDGNRVVGAHCTDRLSGNTLDIRARHTLNATGPWVEPFLANAIPGESPRIQPLPVALNDSWNIVLRRQLFEGAAVALPSAQQVEGQTLASANRMYFVVPWRGRSVVGTVQVPYDTPADAEQRFEEHMRAFINEINAALPGAGLSEADISHVYRGQVPTEDASDDSGTLRRNADEVIDHAERDDLRGLHSIVGVKLTTARAVAERAVDALCAQTHPAAPASELTRVRLAPGPLDPRRPAAEQLTDLTAFEDFARWCIRDGMAMTPGDVLLRRSDLAVLGQPPADFLALLNELLPGTENQATENQRQLP